MDIILPGPQTAREVSGPTAAKPLAGRKSARKGAAPSREPTPGLNASNVSLLLERHGRGTCPSLRQPTRALTLTCRPGASSPDASLREPAGARAICPPQRSLARLPRTEAQPGERAGAVKDGAAATRSVRILERPEPSPTIAQAGSSDSIRFSRPRTRVSCRSTDGGPARFVIGECSAPSRLPSGGYAGLDRTSALPTGGLYAGLTPARLPLRDRRARSIAIAPRPDQAEGKRASARGFVARGTDLYRADSLAAQIWRAASRVEASGPVEHFMEGGARGEAPAPRALCTT
jgi:hypothetical protein